LSVTVVAEVSTSSVPGGLAERVHSRTDSVWALTTTNAIRRKRLNPALAASFA